jgi:MoaA/NifB/PqqE/SkfB family radical SAM enzyme
MSIDWGSATDPTGYAAIVRSAFGSGAARAEDAATHLLPPMLALECLQIEITSWCNFACQQCTRTKLIAQGKWQNEHIPLERYRNIIEKVPRTRQIYLQGVGEPSMHPHFVELVRLASDSEKFDSIHFNSNGHTHDDAYWRSLGNAGYRGLTVALSVDSLDPVIAERCRSGTKADLLWHRLQLFRDSFTWFIVALVASRLNLTDIEQTLRKIGRLGGVPVQITRMMSDDESVVLRPEDEAYLAERIAAIRAEFPDLQLYFNAHNSGFSPNEKRCVAPFLSPFIRADGLLTPCCCALETTHYAGVRADDDRTWDEIRSDPRVLGWVRSFIDEDPTVCQGCTLNPNQKTRVRTV